MVSAWVGRRRKGCSLSQQSQPGQNGGQVWGACGRERDHGEGVGGRQSEHAFTESSQS